MTWNPEEITTGDWDTLASIAEQATEALAHRPTDQDNIRRHFALYRRLDDWTMAVRSVSSGLRFADRPQEVA